MPAPTAVRVASAISGGLLREALAHRHGGGLITAPRWCWPAVAQVRVQVLSDQLPVGAGLAVAPGIDRCHRSLQRRIA